MKKRESTPAIPATATPVPAPSADEWAFPAVRGVQAGHSFYVVTVKLGELHRLFTPVDAQLPPALRAQRALNRARVPKIAAYLLGAPLTYVAVDMHPLPAAREGCKRRLATPAKLTARGCRGQAPCSGPQPGHRGW